MLRVLLQAAFVALVAAVLWYLWANLVTNLRRVGLPTGFGFLDQPTGVDIRDVQFSPGQPIRDAVVVGLIQTVRVAAVGIVLATLLGTLVGISRLSANWLVRRAAAVYVETLRNIPVLVIIIFAYTAVVLRLPPITEAAEWFGLVVFSNRGLAIPWGQGTGNVGAFAVVALAGMIAAFLVGLWRTRRYDATGEPHHRVLWGGGVLLATLTAGYAALGGPVALSLPSRDGLVVTGGIALGAEYAALLFALVFYTASHIAEIVRGSILAVPKGQTEAANAIGLSTFQRLRFVVLPQALRIMIPPLANQCLNLTKNSSLAVAIGFFDITRIMQQAVGNGQPAPQVYLVLMAVYLFLSLVISLAANAVNRAFALETG